MFVNVDRIERTAMCYVKQRERANGLMYVYSKLRRRRRRFFLFSTSIATPLEQTATRSNERSDCTILSTDEGGREREKKNRLITSIQTNVEQEEKGKKIGEEREQIRMYVYTDS